MSRLSFTEFRKIVIVSLLCIVAVGVAFFIQNFELFPNDRVELVEFNKNGDIYKIYGYKGNATVSSTIQLYRNEIMLGASGDLHFYNRGEVIIQTDSTVSLFLINKEDNLQDTFSIKFTEPIKFKY